MAYPAAVYAAINDGTVTMYTGDGGAFYTNGSQGQPVVTQGQLITAGNTYMIHQPRVEGADTHSLTMTTARGSQQTAAGDAQAGEQQTVTYMMATAPQQQQPPAAAAASSSAAEASDPLAQATRVSPATPSSAPPCPPLQPSPLVTEHTKVYIINNSAPPTGAAGRLGGAADPAAEEGDEDDPQEDDVLGLLLLNRVFGPTVQWLNDNYEVAEGVSLPRSTLYSHYLRHCAENKLDPVNAASFGKLIRQVFYGLRTRRLGTRGNSKYHYYGIRVKPESPLNNLTEEVSLMGRQSGGRGSRARREEYQDGNIDMHQTQVQQYLGDSSSAVPNVPDIDLTAQTLPEGVTEEDVTNFTSIYREHCEVLLDAVVTLQFSSVEIIWQQFWRSANNSEDLLDDDPEKIMPKRVLHQLCDWPPVQDYVKTMDYLFYQNLVDVLIPDVLRAIPSTLTQAIRNFAKTLEGWLRSATESTPAGMVRVKLAAVAAFAQTLRRYTSLNHLAQAARAVLQNSGQISQMLADLNRVDFVNVQEQASWVCQCDDSLVQRLEADFKVTLQQQNSLEQWASWLEDVVTTVLKPFENKPEFPKAARQFLLKWSFYSSMVIRDLTLRSAASFGSFHLIRLLYDEYMFYLIENRVARATGEMPIAVMGDRSGQPAPQQPTQTAAERESAFDAPSELLLSNGPLLDGPLAAERGDGDVKRLRRE
ncbi:transcription factor RFX3-like isoform X3 [Amphibalanus amphitrite]|uniref:transcription factor RFX3-like isoform X3 n=2 Tax=Amphibalanus amphitrite TaxID=1232801 RepID=UPI001C8FD6D1|nr:transcription factor RFX3-like isoform X3 [Amphibalanus amphitrite]XP_043211610.1 transcription factor RFX3-like isoform X3 [Amphibalanus amphitrite]